MTQDEGASASAGALLVVSFKPCPVEARSFTSSCMGKHRAADMAMNALGESISYRIRYFVAHLMVDVASLAYSFGAKKTCARLCRLADQMAWGREHERNRQ